MKVTIVIMILPSVLGGDRDGEAEGPRAAGLRGGEDAVD